MGSFQNKDSEKSSQRLQTACIMKTTVAQSCMDRHMHMNRELGGFRFPGLWKMGWQSALEFGILLMMVQWYIRSFKWKL